jgi:pimeloyl-ACP methyl ester carboxylesterase
MAPTLSRRQAVAAGALGVAAVMAGGAGLVQAGVLPGRYRVGRLLGACDVGDPFGMLLEELAPLLSGLGLRTGPGQLGVLGWSMGGAGALRLAETHPGRLAAVVATSPAIAETGSEVAGAGRLTGLAVKVDCGANDPFASGARALATTLPVAQIAVTKGCHDGRYWQEQAPAQLRFLAAALGG